MRKIRGKKATTEFGRWLEQERLARGMTRPDFAATAGYAQSTLTNYSQGTRCPSDARAREIAINLGADEAAAGMAAKADRDAPPVLNVATGEWVKLPDSPESPGVFDPGSFVDRFTEPGDGPISIVPGRRGRLSKQAKTDMAHDNVPFGALLPKNLPIQVLHVSSPLLNDAVSPPAAGEDARVLGDVLGPVTDFVLISGTSLMPFCEDGAVLLIEAKSPALDKPSLVRENGRYAVGYYGVGPAPDTYYRLKPDRKTAELVDGHVEPVGIIRGRIVQGISNAALLPGGTVGRYATGEDLRTDHES